MTGMKLLKFREWKRELNKNKSKILLALLFLTLSLVVFVYFGHYVDNTITVPVPDLILDFLPTVDLSFLYAWSPVFTIVIYLLYSLLYTPKKFHYALGVLSLFVLVRSIFTVLTHLQIPEDAILVGGQGLFGFIAYSNDLFFSGHVGLPFLGFLVFRKSRIRYLFLATSIIMAITVLLMHVHYSIDVASAFFITYGVYVIGHKLFDGEKEPKPVIKRKSK